MAQSVTIMVNNKWLRVTNFGFLMQYHQLNMPTPVFVFSFIFNSLKWAQSKRMAPTNNRGITYETDEKHLCKTIGYLVGEGGGL